MTKYRIIRDNTRWMWKYYAQRWIPSPWSSNKGMREVGVWHYVIGTGAINEHRCRRKLREVLNDKPMQMIEVVDEWIESEEE